MYKENETLILTQNVGREGTDSFIPKDTEVAFIKAVDSSTNISKSMVVIQFEDKQLALPELAVKPKEVDTIDVLKDFNSSMMKSRPDLKIYHHNLFIRVYYKFMNILANIFVNPVKRLFSGLTKKQKSDKVDTEAVRKQLLDLMNED